MIKNQYEDFTDILIPILILRTVQISTILLTIDRDGFTTMNGADTTVTRLLMITELEAVQKINMFMKE